MKILLYCGHRVGSRSFGEWLEKEIGIPFYFEPLKYPYEDSKINLFDDFLKKEFFNKNIEDDLDFIIKISPSDGVIYDKIENF